MANGVIVKEGMTTKQLRKALKKVDPSGEMEVRIFDKEYGFAIYGVYSLEKIDGKAVIR